VLQTEPHFREKSPNIANAKPKQRLGKNANGETKNKPTRLHKHGPKGDGKSRIGDV
jgi:hypothetical protein